MLPVETATDLQRNFFRLLWADKEGYVTIASQTEADRVAKNHKGWREVNFYWPEEEDRLLKHINIEMHGKHVWFTPLIYDDNLKPTARRETNVTETDIVWCDLEEVHPDSITPSAPIVIQSSPNRYQAVWKLGDGNGSGVWIAASLASEYSRRFVEKYKHLGADTGGADLAQLLRVPFTFNYKSEYKLDDGNPPTVRLLTAKDLRVPVQIFDALPPVQGADVVYEDMPEILDADDVIAKYANKLDKSWYELYQKVPEDDWSKVLWRLYHKSFDAGMTKQEVFSVAYESKCNKFKRDGFKPNLSLWTDVLRASAKAEKLNTFYQQFSREPIKLPTLYDPDEVSGDKNFTHRYIAWATSLGDAPPQYHELSGFIVLSALLSGNLRVEATFGDIIPNIWGLILSDTTMTRKSTAMDHATDLLEAVPGCEDVVLATDGTAEGIFKSLASRTSKPSIFKRDEIQGFVASAHKKDYMAGVLESLTKLYDGKTLKRQLSKETITVRDPRFLFYAGGIKTKMFSALTTEHVESGFLPRFFVVTAEGSLENMKPIGTRTQESRQVEGELRAELTHLHDLYVTQRPIQIMGATSMSVPRVVATCKQNVWDKLFDIQKELGRASEESIEPSIFTPMLQRFAMSTLKCAVLIAAARQHPKNEQITVELRDFIDALHVTTKWIPSLVELLSNLGRGAVETDLQRVFTFIKNNEGCPSGAVMRNYRFTAREFANILETLEGRGMVDVRREGKGKFLFAIGE